jgi:hypothetical protein
LTQYGLAVGQGTASPPSNTAIRSLKNKAQVAALVNGIIQGAGMRAAGPQPNLPLPWGDNVLPAGLYAFDYTPLDATGNGQEFRGLKPVIYFCKSGIAVPQPARTVVVDGNTYDVSETPCVHY